VLLQGQVLEGELAVAAEEEGEYPKQVERDHRVEIVAGSELKNQPLARQPRFWRGTGLERDDREVKP
jgi:hypothetical protein